jgi:hypothetical protein
MSNILLRNWYKTLINNRNITSVFGIKKSSDKLLLYPYQKDVFNFDLIDFSHTKVGFDTGVYGQPIIILDNQESYTFSTFRKAEKHLEQMANRAPKVDYNDDEMVSKF